MKSLVWRLIAGTLASVLVVVVVLVVFAEEKVDSIGLSGDSRYVAGYAYDLTVAVLPPDLRRRGPLERARTVASGSRKPSPSPSTTARRPSRSIPLARSPSIGCPCVA